MVALKIGEDQYPLVLTVGALDRLAVRGETLETLFEFTSTKGRTFAEAVENGFELLDILAWAGKEKADLEGESHPGMPDLELARLVLTPGQVLGLCDAAILDGLRRTVEADYSKNAGGAEAESP